MDSIINVAGLIILDPKYINSKVIKLVINLTNYND